MENQNTISQLHKEHKEWLNKLLFYRDELSIMDGRILEVAKKKPGKEVMVMVEHFQNQVIIQNEQIDILNHDIKSHEAYLHTAVEKKGADIGTENFSDHQKHRESIAVFEKIFRELREEFIGFLAKSM
ncbi:hypothetical protein P872_21750 [Rhodonellum psychrophilum GCM71 = DSM 17998]|uniref:DUF2383 domain-containing protein n=2 Tax=Rhodonellum TaxID=336827 RepID=U5BX00_9BACT|nr:MULTISPECIES: hypothetical protein [Rhodonellum]ERM80437.1 hypothetical protein P872_21750 [Rhodonellum psychrophilum GCM71 = DSM 17998]SDZ08141.1 hypothetical protein SAMN05444412_105214 [Rhodonellum ikkaensis]